MIVQVRVKPNSRTRGVVANADGTLTISLTSPPVEGKANAELLDVLSKHLGVPKARISIKTGAGSRTKLVKVAD